MPYLGQRSISPQSGQPHNHCNHEEPWDGHDTSEACAKLLGASAHSLGSWRRRDAPAWRRRYITAAAP
eukprot:2123893-Prymnesium_polylepis.1